MARNHKKYYRMGLSVVKKKQSQKKKSNGNKKKSVTTKIKKKTKNKTKCTNGTAHTPYNLNARSSYALCSARISGYFINVQKASVHQIASVLFCAVWTNELVVVENETPLHEIWMIIIICMRVKYVESIIQRLMTTRRVPWLSFLRLCYKRAHTQSVPWTFIIMYWYWERRPS